MIFRCVVMITAALLLLIMSSPISFVVANPKRSDEQDSDTCYNNCVTSADMSLWPTTPPADEDDEEPRCKADIRFTADCIYQCEDLSLFACIAGALQITTTKLRKVLETVSVAKYCQGCRFFDNENCHLSPRAWRHFNATKSSDRHPFLAALSPFVKGLYLLDNVACHSATKSLRDTLNDANVLNEICEWLHCENVAIQVAPGCNDVVRYMQSIVKIYSQSYLKCPSSSPSPVSSSTLSPLAMVTSNSRNKRAPGIL